MAVKLASDPVALVSGAIQQASNALPMEFAVLEFTDVRCAVCQLDFAVAVSYSKDPLPFVSDSSRPSANACAMVLAVQHITFIRLLIRHNKG